MDDKEKIIKEINNKSEDVIKLWVEGKLNNQQSGYTIKTFNLDAVDMINIAAQLLIMSESNIEDGHNKRRDILSCFNSFYRSLLKDYDGEVK